MATFEYKAINDTGKIVLGRIDASNDSDLEMRLGRMGLEMIRCWPARQGGWSSRGGKVGDNISRSAGDFRRSALGQSRRDRHQRHGSGMAAGRRKQTDGG